MINMLSIVCIIKKVLNLRSAALNQDLNNSMQKIQNIFYAEGRLNKTKPNINRRKKKSITVICFLKVKQIIDKALSYSE